MRPTIGLATQTSFERPDGSFSSASIFIVSLLTEVLLGGLLARDDRFREDRALVFDKWYEVAIVAVRRSRLDQLAEEGRGGAAAAKTGVGQLDAFIATIRSISGVRRGHKGRLLRPSSGPHVETYCRLSSETRGGSLGSEPALGS